MKHPSPCLSSLARRTEDAVPPQLPAPSTQPLLKINVSGNFLPLFCSGVSLFISRYLQRICRCANTLFPSPKRLGVRIFRPGPFFPKLVVCLVGNTSRRLCSPTREPRARDVPPPLGYRHEMNSSLFLSKITFISLVSLTSVSVWSHTATLTRKSRRLRNSGSASPSPWAAAGSAVPPTGKRIPPPWGLTRDEGNKQICSLSST